jgi:hypothetical protein
MQTIIIRNQSFISGKKKERLNNRNIRDLTRAVLKANKENRLKWYYDII